MGDETVRRDFKSPKQRAAVCFSQWRRKGKADAVDLVEAGSVPSDVSKTKADEKQAWSAPTLADFTDKSWGDLSASERRRIAGHYAWSASMPPESFGDLKLPHHNPKGGAVVWRGVANALARLPQTDLPASDKGAVLAHLQAHARAFGKGRDKKAANALRELHAFIVAELKDPLQAALDEQYDQHGPEQRLTIIDVNLEESSVVALDFSGDVPEAVRLTFAETGDPPYTFGEPHRTPWQYTDRIEVAAAKVVTGQAATELIAALKQDNPLFSRLDGSPNGHFVVMDLTTLDRVSQHEGPVQYKLLSAGIKDALPTLIGKPVHVTTDFDGHLEAGARYKPIGVFMGGQVLEGVSPTGGSTLRVVAMLWDGDFPEELEEIQNAQHALGASYEVAYSPSDAIRNGNVIEVTKYVFAGGAILKKTAAAHPETQLLVANAPSMWTARPREETPPATSRDTTRRIAMGKFGGIPAEHDAAVQAAVDAALAAQEQSRSKSTLEADNTRLKEQLAAQEQTLGEQAAKITALEAEKVALTNQANEKTAALVTATAELATLREEKDAVEKAAAIEAGWKKIATEHGFSLTDEKIKAAKLPLLTKLANKEALTVDEYLELGRGGVRPGAADGSRMRLVVAGASGTPDAPDPDALKKTWPSLGKVVSGKSIFR